VVRTAVGACDYFGPARQCGSAAVGLAVLGSMVVTPRWPAPFLPFPVAGLTAS